MTCRLRNSRAQRSYERVADRLLALPCVPDRPSCLFRDGRLLVGSQSKHRYSNARKWRCFWRIKTNRRPLRESFARPQSFAMNPATFLASEEKTANLCSGLGHQKAHFENFLFKKTPVLP